MYSTDHTRNPTQAPKIPIIPEREGGRSHIRVMPRVMGGGGQNKTPARSRKEKKSSVVQQALEHRRPSRARASIFLARLEGARSTSEGGTEREGEREGEGKQGFSRVGKMSLLGRPSPRPPGSALSSRRSALREMRPPETTSQLGKVGREGEKRGRERREREREELGWAGSASTPPPLPTLRSPAEWLR